MKRVDLVRQLEKNGFVKRHGGKHDIFKKDGGAPVTVPRHTEIAEGTANAILKQAGIETRG